MSEKRKVIVDDEEFDVEFAVNNIELVGLNGGGQAGEEQTVTSG